MIVRELIKVLQAHPENALVILEEYNGEEFYIRAIGPVEGNVLIKIESENDERSRACDREQE